MLITLQELELRRIVVSKTYKPDDLDYHGAEFQQVSPLRVDAAAELVGSEIRIRGRLSTRLRAACDRCLAPVEFEVKPVFDLSYRPASTIAREEEIEVSKDELDVGFYWGEGIELADVVTEQVILAVPMKVVCRPNCRGLCPVCKANRNLERCDCPPHPPESPFAFLKEQ